MLLCASAHGTDVCELAFGQFALAGLEAAANGLAFVHANPIGWQVGDFALALPAALFWQALRRAVRLRWRRRDLRGLPLGGAVGAST